MTSEQIQTDVTDTYNITAVDDDDLSYGMRSVDLGGDADNAGSTLQRSVTNWDKQNSGCTWDEENGEETTRFVDQQRDGDGQLVVPGGRHLLDPDLPRHERSERRVSGGTRHSEARLA